MVHILEIGLGFFKRKPFSSFFPYRVRKPIPLKTIWYGCSPVNVLHMEHLLIRARGNSGPNLCPCCWMLPLMIFFFHNFVLYTKNCVNMLWTQGLLNLVVPFYSFYRKKCPFVSLPDTTFNFWNNPWEPTFRGLLLKQQEKSQEFKSQWMTSGLNYTHYHVTITL